MENFKYLRVFRMSGIQPDEGEMICNYLSRETLDKLIGINNMRIIKPILEAASNMQNGICDENVNGILNDTNKITKFMAQYL